MLNLETSRLHAPFQPEGPPLRVRLLAEKDAPQWALAFRSWLETVPGLEISAGVCSPSGSPPEPGGLVFRRWEDFARGSFDPFRPSPWAGTEASDCDIEIWLGTGSPPDAVAGRFGGLSVQYGEGDRWPPYWTEASERRTVSKAAIAWHEQTWSEFRIVAEAELATRPSWVFTRSAEDPLIALSRMLGEICLSLRAGRERWVQEARLRGAPHQWTPRAWGRPDPWETASFAGHQAMRSLRHRWENRNRSLGWFIALRQKGGSFQEVPMPPGAQMADPFLASGDGNTWLYYEDVPAGSSKGRLAVRQVLGPANYGPPAVILERPFHLSYPLLVEDRGERFLLPEGFDGGALELYRCKAFPHEFEFETTLLRGVENGLGVDTTPIQIDGIWYFFTALPEPFLETLLFWSDRLDGKWRMHPASPISRSVYNCRPAGAVFKKDGKLLRPSQDCSLRYGYAMTIYEILRLTPHEYQEREWRRIGPDWHPGLLGTHTWNELGDCEVIDGLRYS